MRKIVRESDTIKVDSGIFFGKGVFETILILDRPLFLKFHLERLNKGLEIIGLEKVKENLGEIINRDLKKNSILKIVVTEKNIIFNTREIPYKEEDYKKGFKLKISEVRRNSTSPLAKIKSLNYLDNILAREKALKLGYNDALFLNEKGYMCETSTANIFFVEKGEIYTAKADEGLLNGTVRDWILKNFNVKFKNYEPKDLEGVDEVFVTNSIIGIMKIIEIDNYKFSKDRIVKEVTERYIREKR